MQINPDIILREHSIQMDVMRARVLNLAQALENACNERDALRTELDGLKAELARGAADGATE